MAPAWLGALLKSNRANASGLSLSPDIQAMLSASQCNVASASSKIPFICLSLAGGANLVGSEVLVGGGRPVNFLSTAGYGKLGVPATWSSSTANVDASLGLLFTGRLGDHARHQDQGDYRGDGCRDQRRGLLRDVAE